MTLISFFMALTISAYANAQNYSLETCIADENDGLWAVFDSGDDKIFEIDFVNEQIQTNYIDDNPFTECDEDEALPFENGIAQACGPDSAPTVEVDSGDDIIYRIQFETVGGELVQTSFTKLYTDDNPTLICQ
jgi:hypothetical protein